jgi:Tfp pilus assembly protein PilV
MNASPRIPGRQTGGSLLEVAIALGIAALSLVGTISSQLVAVRTEKSSAQREVASLIAASAADALRERSAAAGEIEYWRVQAMQALPRGDIVVRDAGGGAAFVAVRWASSQAGGHALGRARPIRFDGCPPEFAAPEVSCSVAPLFLGATP